MKKTLILITAVAIVSFLSFTNQFSCTKTNKGSDLLGNSDQSPLKANTESSKACEIQDTFRKIFDMYKDRVVYITTEQIVRVPSNPFFEDPFMREFFGRGNRNPKYQKRSGLGTGFIISEDGYICTNHHVIDKVDKITVGMADKTYEAKIIGFDSRTDIALLKINTTVKLQSVYFGDSDKVNVGDWAIAIGSPFGLNNTFTVGVISAINRHDVDMMGGAHIQTDASINPGNSGGPLINIYGEVVGINRMIYSKSGGYMGIGFAIPINTARTILAQLKEHKKVQRGYLGVSIIPLDEEYARKLGMQSNEGAFVGEVVQDSPADKGGIVVGDVIINVSDKPVKDFKDLMSGINSASIGSRLKIGVWRDRRLVNLYIKIEDRP